MKSTSLNRLFVIVPLVLAASGCATLFGNRGEHREGELDGKVLDSRPKSTYSSLRTQVRDLRNSGKLDRAREVCRDLIKHYPDKADGYHQLALVADKQKRYREAQGLYAQAIRLKHADAEIFNNLGYSYYLGGQLDNEESALAKSVAMSPHEDRYRINLGLVVGQQRRYDEALEHFRLAGSEADAQYNLAFVLATHDAPQRAQACFQKAIAADPSHEKSRKALRAFEQFERDPDAAARDEALASGAKGYMPYVEDGSRVVQASGESTGGRAATAALQQQAKSSFEAKFSRRGL